MSDVRILPRKRVLAETAIGIDVFVESLRKRTPVRNMSFSLTTGQILERSKTITRRGGWTDIKPGAFLCAVEKGMGLKKGEKVQRLDVIRVISVRREPLYTITQADVDCEGFPLLDPSGFIAMYCEHNRVKPRDLVTRIEFEYPFELVWASDVEVHSSPAGTE